MRVRIRVELRTVVRFAVQYEALTSGGWLPVVRYDSAHGFAHRDRLDRTGRTIEKLFLGSAERYAEIVTSAIRDIKVNWPRYRAAMFKETL